MLVASEETVASKGSVVLRSDQGQFHSACSALSPRYGTWVRLTVCSWEYVVAQGGGRGKLIEYQLLGESGPQRGSRAPSAVFEPVDPVEPVKLEQ